MIEQQKKIEFEVYHTGMLPEDRGEGKCGALVTEAHRKVDAAANEAYSLMRKGLVTLTQKRVEENVFEYRMTWLNRPNTRH